MNKTFTEIPIPKITTASVTKNPRIGISLNSLYITLKITINNIVLIESFVLIDSLYLFAHIFESVITVIADARISNKMYSSKTAKAKALQA